jgi:hypothetical protein
MEWISVKDRLPKMPDEVLCWYIDLNGNENFTPGFYDTYEENWNTDYIDWEAGFEVTHWAFVNPPKD